MNTQLKYEDAQFISKLFNRDVIYNETYISSVDNSFNDMSSYTSAIRDRNQINNSNDDVTNDVIPSNINDASFQSDTHEGAIRLPSPIMTSSMTSSKQLKERRIKSQIETGKPKSKGKSKGGITVVDPPLPPLLEEEHTDESKLWGYGMKEAIIAYGDEHLNKWNYNFEKLLKFSDDHILETMFIYFFNKFELFSDELPYELILKWITTVASMYNPENPYHNAYHAGDALQAASYMMTRPKISQYLDQDMRLALLISVAIHDIMHPGKTNAFLISTSGQVAIDYNDRSVLENNSVALAFDLMKKNPDLNIFAFMNPVRYYRMRRFIIRLVLSTDMGKYHGPMLELFKNRLAVGFDPSSHITSMETPDRNGLNREGKNKHFNDSELLCVMIIKAADISNPTRKFELSKMWGKRLRNEFYVQGDAERARGMTITKFMDRNIPNDFPKQQYGFISGVCMDFFSVFYSYAGMDKQLDSLKSNFKQWEELKSKIETK